MNSSARATRVHFDQDCMWVNLSDGRIIGVPLAWFALLTRSRGPIFWSVWIAHNMFILLQLPYSLR